MSIYLQAETPYANLWWVLGALIVLAIVFFLTRKAQHKQAAREIKTADPRHNVVNDSSYNIAQEGIDGHRDEGLSAEEAKRAAEQMKENGHVASEEEFYKLRKDMDGKE